MYAMAAALPPAWLDHGGMCAPTFNRLPPRPPDLWEVLLLWSQWAQHRRKDQSEEPYLSGDRNLRSSATEHLSRSSILPTLDTRRNSIMTTAAGLPADPAVEVVSD